MVRPQGGNVAANCSVMQVVMLFPMVLMLSLLVVGCKDPYTENDWKEKSESEMTSLLGRAMYERSITLDQKSPLYEYQSGLTKYLSNTGEKLEFKEYEWKTRERTVVVWMLKRDDSWYVVDSLIWSKEIKF